jgi:putative copper export protein
MSTRNTVLHALHDVGLAAWFGGSLFGLAGLNAAAEEAGDRQTADRISSIGWAKWSPLNFAAIAAHTIGGAGLLAENRKRALAQKGHTGTVNAKLALTIAAIAASGYTRLVGKKVEDAVVHQASGVSSSTTSAVSDSTAKQGGATATGETIREADKRIGQAASTVAEQLPVDVARANRQLHALQYAIPVLTGAIVVLSAQASEQQRPGDQLRGFARRATEAVSNIAA